MNDTTDTRQIGWNAGEKPHAYDPFTQPQLFDSVLSRRVVAFLIDLVVLAIPVVLAWTFIFVFGVVTLGLGFFLYAIMPPLVVVWALLYYGMTIGSERSATIGMRTVGIEVRTWYGAPGYFLLGAIHVILYWISVTAVTPFILLLGLFNGRRRLAHDFVTGVVIVNSAPLGRK